MSCQDAMTAKLVTVPSHETLAHVLALMGKEGVDAVPVLGDRGELAGLFSYASLFKNILPVAVTMADGMALDVRINAAPGLEMRMKKALAQPVAQFMDPRPVTVLPQTPLWEGIQAMLQQQGPLPVIDGASGRILGMMTMAAAATALQTMKD